MEGNSPHITSGDEVFHGKVSGCTGSPWPPPMSLGSGSSGHLKGNKPSNAELSA